MGQFVQNQVNNKTSGNPRATLTSKIAHLKPTTFVGVEDPTILEDQIREFEMIFGTTGTPDDQKDDQAAFYLRNKAEIWWSSNRTALLAQEGFGWEAFKTALRAKYYPLICTVRSRMSSSIFSVVV